MLLANFLHGLPSLEITGISFWNHGSGRDESNLIGKVAIAYCLLAILMMCSGNDALRIGAGIGSLVMLGFYAKSHQSETKSKHQFEKAAMEASLKEAVVAEVFPGFSGAKAIANETYSTDLERWSYLLDWVRNELLVLTVQIENGNESMRGELRIKFRVASGLFGDVVDNGQGFNFFFSREVLKFMKHSREQFTRVIKS